MNTANTLVVCPNTSFVGKYTKDYNILKIHASILDKFEKDKTIRVNELRLKMALEAEKIKKPQRPIDRKYSLKQIENAENEVNSILAEKDLKKYLSEAEELIKEYQRIGPSNKIITFGVKNKEGPITDDDEKRIRIISRYILVAKKYIPIDLIHESEIKDKCGGCGILLTDAITNNDNGEIQYCPQCGLTINIFNKNNHQFKDSSYSNDGYEDRENFLKSFYFFQGKDPIKLDVKLYSDLDRYFTSYHLKTGEEIRGNPLLKNGTKEKTSRSMMYEALQKLYYNTLYEHCTFICVSYWGWEPPELSFIENKLMSHYDKTQVVFRRLPQKYRTSNLNRQFRLFKHLEILYHNGDIPHYYNVDNFKMVKTRDILEAYDEIWRKMCEGANDEEIKFYKTI